MKLVVPTPRRLKSSLSAALCATLAATLTSSFALSQSSTTSQPGDTASVPKKPSPAAQVTTGSKDLELAYQSFNKGDLPEFAISQTCYFDNEQDPSPSNKELCQHLMTANNNDPSTEVVGGRDVPVAEVKPDMVDADGAPKSIDGDDVGDHVSKPEEKKVESVSQKSGFLYTAQRIGGGTSAFASKLKEQLNPEVQFFGLFAEHADGHTAPFMAAAVQFRKEFKKVVFLDKLGVKKVNITVLTNPFAVLAIPQIRNSIRRSDEFNEGVREAAIHHISAATGIPADRVPELVPASKIDEAIAQATAIATRDLNQRVSYANGLRTMINEAYATFYLNDAEKDADGMTKSGKTGWTLRIGKISPNQQRSLLKESTNLMFSSSYQVSARMSRSTYAVTVTMSSMLGPQESPLGGLVEAYIRAMIRQGADYFSIKPNAVDVNTELRGKWFQERGIPLISGMMVGGGAVSGRPFGYFRVDAKKGPVSGSYMGYWQACKSGNENWLGCYDHKSVQTRHFGTLKADLAHFKNPIVKSIAKAVHEVKTEFYSTQGSEEGFRMGRLVVERQLPGVFQKVCRSFGTCAAEASIARVNLPADAHGSHGSSDHGSKTRSTNIFGLGLVLKFRKPTDHATTDAHAADAHGVDTPETSGISEQAQLLKKLQDVIAKQKITPSDLATTIRSKTGDSRKAHQLNVAELKDVLLVYGVK